MQVSHGSSHMHLQCGIAAFGNPLNFYHILEWRIQQMRLMYLLEKSSCSTRTSLSSYHLESTVQSASIARSQGLLDSFYVSSSCNFCLARLRIRCSMAHQPGELQQKLSSKPCDRAIDALCTIEGMNPTDFSKLIPSGDNFHPMRSTRLGSRPRRRHQHQRRNGPLQRHAQSKR